LALGGRWKVFRLGDWFYITERLKEPQNANPRST
jgi:hypothetical protein